MSDGLSRFFPIPAALVVVNPIQRLFRSSRAQRKPWLARKPWRERRIVNYGGPRGLYFALALVAFGIPAIFLGVVGVGQMVEGDPDGVFNLGGAALCAGILAFITYLWLRRRRFGTSVCHLETLPGVIGGWFKASIEFTLPVEAPGPVLVSLINSKMVGRRPVTCWETSQRVSTTRFTRVGANRYLVPVRFRIPAAAADYATWNWLTGGGWFLSVKAELPGMDFSRLSMFLSLKLERRRLKSRGLKKNLDRLVSIAKEGRQLRQAEPVQAKQGSIARWMELPASFEGGSGG